MFSVALRLLILCVALAGATGPAWAQTDIGGAIEVENQVEGELDGTLRALATSSRVFQNERIITHADSAASFRFLDDTVLSMGARSEIVLDRMVYDPDTSTGDILLNVVTGGLRMVTGMASSESYRLVTKHAVVGVRGTDLGVYSGSLGTVVITHGGDSFACPRYLLDAPRPDGPGCCNLDADEAGAPVYGIIRLGSRNCIGPRRWTGTNPFTLLGRAAIRDTVRDRRRDRRRDEPEPETSPGPTPGIKRPNVQ